MFNWNTLIERCSLNIVRININIIHAQENIKRVLENIVHSTFQKSYCEFRCARRNPKRGQKQTRHTRQYASSADCTPCFKLHHSIRVGEKNLIFYNFFKVANQWYKIILMYHSLAPSFIFEETVKNRSKNGY